MTWKYHDYFLFTIIGGGGCLEIELKRRTDRKLQLNSNLKKKNIQNLFHVHIQDYIRDYSIFPSQGF